MKIIASTLIITIFATISAVAALAWSFSCDAASVTYGYDSLNRLTRADYGSGQLIVTYAYDAAGNMGSKNNTVPPSGVATSNGYSSYFLEVGPYRAYASFNVSYASGATLPSGSMTFTSSRYRKRITMQSAENLVVIGGMATFGGPCVVNYASGYTCTATVTDNGSPGVGKDSFGLTVTGPSGFHYSASGIIASGEYTVSQ